MTKKLTWDHKIKILSSTEVANPSYPKSDDPYAVENIFDFGIDEKDADKTYGVIHLVPGTDVERIVHESADFTQLTANALVSMYRDGLYHSSPRERMVYQYNPIPGTYLAMYRVFNNSFSEYSLCAILSIGTPEEIERAILKVITSMVLDMTKTLHKEKEERLSDNTQLFDRIFLEGDLKKSIVGDVGRFLDNKKVYDDLGIPWKRGYIFEGPPGNGKTLLLRSIINAFGLEATDMTECIRQGRLVLGKDEAHADYTSRDRGAIISIQYEARSLSEDIMPHVYYIEDLEKIVSHQSRDDSAVITLSNLLNELDGVSQLSAGTLVIATTNYMKDFAEAITGRPGRFDRIFQFPLPSSEQKSAFFKYLKFTVLDANGIDVTEGFVEELKGYSMAFAEEFVKSCKMECHSKDISLEVAEDVMARIHRHNELHRKITNKVGFSSAG